jgi:hypothetical protein
MINTIKDIRSESSNSSDSLPQEADDRLDLEETMVEDGDEEIAIPFDPSLIRVDTRPMTVDLVLERIKHQEIDLAPDFQRDRDIWNDVAKSRLIESILIRIPLPAFYMDATDEDRWLVIDGLQRLSALKKFAIDGKMRLQGMEFLKNLNDKTFEELSRIYQRRIKETVLTIYSIERGTPDAVKYNIFRRINTGGKPLSSQELRHALNPGNAMSFLQELAKNEKFIEMLALGEDRKKRMEDREFILGFIAFYLTPYDGYPTSQGRDYFLNDAMKKINDMNDKELANLKGVFEMTMQIAWDIFGKQAFRKISLESSRKQPINKSLFEAWSVSLSKFDNDDRAKSINKKEDILRRFADRVDSDPEFVKAISQASDKIPYRFKTIETIIAEVIS